MKGSRTDDGNRQLFCKPSTVMRLSLPRYCFHVLKSWRLPIGKKFAKFTCSCTSAFPTRACHASRGRMRTGVIYCHDCSPVLLVQKMASLLPGLSNDCDQQRSLCILLVKEKYGMLFGSLIVLNINSLSLTMKVLKSDLASSAGRCLSFAFN